MRQKILAGLLLGVFGKREQLHPGETEVQECRENGEFAVGDRVVVKTGGDGDSHQTLGVVGCSRKVSGRKVCLQNGPCYPSEQLTKVDPATVKLMQVKQEVGKTHGMNGGTYWTEKVRSMKFAFRSAGDILKYYVRDMRGLLLLMHSKRMEHARLYYELAVQSCPLYWNPKQQIDGQGTVVQVMHTLPLLAQHVKDIALRTGRPAVYEASIKYKLFELNTYATVFANRLAGNADERLHIRRAIAGVFLHLPDVAATLKLNFPGAYPTLYNMYLFDIAGMFGKTIAALSSMNKVVFDHIATKIYANGREGVLAVAQNEFATILNHPNTKSREVKSALNTLVKHVHSDMKELLETLTQYRKCYGGWNVGGDGGSEGQGCTFPSKPPQPTEEQMQDRLTKLIKDFEQQWKQDVEATVDARLFRFRTNITDDFGRRLAEQQEKNTAELENMRVVMTEYANKNVYEIKEHNKQTYVTQTDFESRTSGIVDDLKRTVAMEAKIAAEATIVENAKVTQHHIDGLTSRVAEEVLRQLKQKPHAHDLVPILTEQIVDRIMGPINDQLNSMTRLVANYEDSYRGDLEVAEVRIRQLQQCFENVEKLVAEKLQEAGVGHVKIDPYDQSNVGGSYDDYNVLVD